MVEIPVEKKRSGLPWWAWLLIVLAVVALLWFLLTRDGREAEAVGTETPVAAAGEARPAGAAAADGQGGVVTDVAALTGAATGLVGMQVNLSNVEVVSADETGGLFIGDSAGERVFVSTSIPSGFAAGSRVNVRGTVQGGDAATAGRAGPPAGLPAGATHYIEADSIQPA